MDDHEETVWLSLDRASRQQRRAIYRLWSKDAVRYLRTDEASTIIGLLVQAYGRMNDASRALGEGGDDTAE